MRNEALMVIIFMGDERLTSGSLFIPNSPYFIGLNLCHGDDRVNQPYVGSYFKKGGGCNRGDAYEHLDAGKTKINQLSGSLTSSFIREINPG